MLANTTGCSVTGVDGLLIDVEVDVSRGLPTFATVGLPDSSVRESKDRVKAAINNCGYEFPNRKITVNLAPADVKKEGASFDLPIAVGILAAIGLISKESFDKVCFAGELSLDGRVRRCKGILPMILAAAEAGYEQFILPEENREEAAIAASSLKIIPVSSLPEAMDFLIGETQIVPVENNDYFSAGNCRNTFDFSEVKGQHHVKRAMEIAAAGGHNIMMSGPPGSGKTMLARRLPSILPAMSMDELIETTRVYSVSDIHVDTGVIRERPFRAPHHTVSDAGLIGGGTNPRPGEVSLAHNGVLFLDELPEFRKHVLEVLRQPLEDGHITISRASQRVNFPSRFVLVAAMNPCPCGYLGDSIHSCTCHPGQIERYRNKLSGPLLDRIDLHVHVPAVSYQVLQEDGNTEETSSAIRERVNRVREVQQRRFLGENSVFCNSHMGSREIQRHCKLDSAASAILQKGMARLGLSARGYNRVMKIARTIADLEGEANIGGSHVAEAIQYRRSAL